MEGVTIPMTTYITGDSSKYTAREKIRYHKASVQSQEGLGGDIKSCME